MTSSTLALISATKMQLVGPSALRVLGAAETVAPSIVSVTLNPSTGTADSAIGTVVGALSFVMSDGSAPAGIFALGNTVTGFELVSGDHVAFASATIAAGPYAIDGLLTVSGAANSPFSWNASITVNAATGTAPVNTADPTISGSLVVGQVLAAVTGTWTGSPTSYAYQWLRNGLPITGATASTYALLVADVAAVISVQVTAVNSIGSAMATSASVGPITSGASGLTGTVTVTMHNMSVGILPSANASAGDRVSLTLTGSGPLSSGLNLGTYTVTANDAAIAGNNPTTNGAGYNAAVLFATAINGNSDCTTAGITAVATDAYSGEAQWSYGLITIALPANTTISVMSSTTGNSYSVTKTNGGSVSTVPVTYDLAAATELGEFTSPAGYTQLNYALPINAALPNLQIFYRPDSAGSRQELVFEQSNATTQSPMADLGAYTAESSIAGATLSGSVPVHYCGARWRMQTAPRTPYTTIAALVAAGIVPSYQADGAPIYGSVQAYTPMGFAGVTPFFPQTGERDDLGVLPAWTTSYIATGNAVMGEQMFANAEASASVNWHWRDETGQVFSIDRHPDWAQSSNAYPVGKQIAYAEPYQLSPGVADDAHQPSLAFVPYLLTGDLYYLEECQFAGNNILWAAGSHNGTGMTIVLNTQIRGMAWSLRQLAFATAATPASVPSWILDQDYFSRKLENLRKLFFATGVEGANPVAARFQFPQFAQGLASARGSAIMPTWQNDYCTAVFGQMVRMGFENWRGAFEWTLQAIRARTNGTSGWPRSVPYWYYVDYMDLTGSPLEAFENYADLLAYNTTVSDLSQPANIVVPPTDTYTTTDINYFGDITQVMRHAISLGYSDITPLLAWYEGQSTLPPQKYLVAKALAPTAVAMPTSAGDPQYTVPTQTLTGSNATLADGALYITGTGVETLTWPGTLLINVSGQTIIVDDTVSPKSILVQSMHDGSSVCVKNIAHLQINDAILDCATATWS